ncbi:MAG: glutamate racemase [Patescibacteria group bacterium]|nr:glutamate racemase [Patescibacteria group bacterium]MDD5294783.1 glutamate racemase [Patescibacteria group bacterium]MDD5554280.1 glutamate racemase [Patescibacteria group bacterium]
MIGVFDSGFGGLTILKAFLDKLPEYNYIYLGDSARAPYGNKSPELIYKYTEEAVDFLFKKGCELIIVACNTVSAEALRKIQQKWLPENYSTRRVLGVIIPITEALVEEVKKSPGKNQVGIIGTRSTIESKAYSRELEKLSSDLEISSQACPLLVPLVEEGWVKRKETKMILKYYLRPLKLKKIDYLILGCTHYSILFKEIEKVMGKRCQVFDSPKFVAEKLALYLRRHPEIEGKILKERKMVFYTTDDPQRFRDLGEKFLGQKMEKIEKVSLQ